MKFDGIVGDCGSKGEVKVYTSLRIRCEGEDGVKKAREWVRGRYQVETETEDEKDGVKFLNFRVVGGSGIMYDKGSSAGADAYRAIKGGGVEVKDGVIIKLSEIKDSPANCLKMELIEVDGKEVVNGFGILV